MARRLSVGLLAAGTGLTVLLPVVGALAMVMAAVALAISLEHDLLSDHRTSAAEGPRSKQLR